MKPYQFFILSVVIVMILSACAPQVAQTPSAGPTQPAEPSQAPSGETPVLQAVTQAQQFLSQQLNVPLDDVKAVSWTPMEWPDSCLGLGQPNESCLAAITPGYEVTLEVSGQTFTLRTNVDGSVVRIAPQQEPTPSAGVEGPVQAAKAAVSGLLGISAEDVKVVSSEPVEWSDACLGLGQADEMCAQMITPGYKITVEANGQQYVFHTDQTGSSIRQETAAPQAPQGDLGIQWKLEGENCLAGGVSADENVSYGPCGGKAVSAPLGSVNAARPEQLADLLAAYASFTAETPAGSVTFTGYGTQAATPAEQRSIAEWMRLVVREVTAGRGSAADGLVIGWHREGGIAGFCDDLGVYVDGYAMASSCKGNPPLNQATVRLTAAQLEQLYAWLDSLQPFEIDQTDPATADAMTVRVVFSGLGKQAPTQDDKNAILTFAQDVYNQAGMVPAEAGLPAAQDALTSFFDLLNQGQYAEAAQLYHGSLAALINANPELRPVDPAQLFEAACTRSGYMCLKVKTVVEAKALTANRYSFKVTFANPDGSTFEQGPCCGATDGVKTSTFDYTVRQIAGAYFVTALPPYVP